MTAAIPPEPRLEGSIVEPVTEAEKLAVTAFLNSVGLHGDWGRAAAAQAEVGRHWCAARAAEAAGRR